MKRLVKSIISPLEDDEEPPKPTSANINTERRNSIPDIEDRIEQPVIQPQSSPQPTSTPKYQNPPPHYNSNNVEFEDVAAGIIKVACILVMSTVILNSVTTSIKIDDSAVSTMLQAVQGSMAMGYTLAAIMVLVVTCGAIAHMLGGMRP